jgi:hypothetical protein
MPKETKQAVDWALQQKIETPYGEEQISKDMAADLVDKVREYFNINLITYPNFSYNDLLPYL